MNTIIEKIRAEVERLKAEHQTPTFRGDEYEEGGVNGYQLALDKVLAKLSDLEKEEKPMNPQPVKIDIRKELASIEFMGVNDARDTETIARHFYALGQQSKEQPVDWQKVAEAHAKDQPLGQDNDGNLVYLQEHPVWHNVEKETPTSFGEGVIVLCKNKNKEDGIWLTDFIPCWEGEWKPRDNWETPVKWAYVRDFYPKAEQSVTLSVKDAMKALDEKIAKVKKAGSWKNPELLDEMRAEQPVCEDAEMEIKETELEYQQRSERGEYPASIESIARHFYELGRQSKPKVCEGLEEEIQKYMSERWEFGCINPTTPVYLYDFTTDELKECARHFAKWGAEHRGGSEIPNDLESYAQTVEDYYDVGEERGYLCTHRGDIKNAVLAGAKWQKEQDEKELSEKIAGAYQLGRKDEKEQMMKDCVHEVNQAYFRGIDVGKARQKDLMMKEAVEGIVMNFSSNEPKPTVIVDAKGFNQGDRVRVIVCKKED